MTFALRDALHESTEFSPLELVFGHDVRGSLSMMKEKWLSEDDVCTSVVDYVDYGRVFKSRLLIAEANME